MSRSVFGWSYPPGAANDPYAPYNQVDGPDIVMLKECTIEARKEHQCYLCGETIKVGEQYRYFVYIDYDNNRKLKQDHGHINCPLPNHGDWAEALANE
jgi:hypothetical protein